VTSITRVKDGAEFYSIFKDESVYKNNLDSWSSRITDLGLMTIVPVPGHDCSEISYERDGQFAWINITGNNLYPGRRVRISMWYDIKDEQVELKVKDGICFVLVHKNLTEQ
jgi:hypothetical protein